MNAIGTRLPTALVGGLAVLAVVGFVVTSLGAAPWLLVVAAVAIAFLVLGQRAPWLPAAALTVVGSLALFVVYVRVAQPIDASLDIKVRALLAIVCLAGIAVLWRRRRTLRLPTASVARPVLLAFAPIVLLTIGAVIAVAVSDGGRVAWAMQNDAIWNTMMARFLWMDGGAGPAHPNVSPLIPALLAGAFAAGREGVAAADLLRHDVTREAELWLLLVLVSSLLAGLLGWRGFARSGTVARTIGAFLVALIPLCWYGAGYSFQFGFFNATVSLFVLLCAWIGWLTAREGRMLAILILSASTIVMLATWAPLGIVCIGLGMGVLATAGRAWWLSIRGGRLAALVVALGVIPAYLVSVTLPDILREGKGLAANGGIIAIEPRHILVVGLAGLAVTAVLALRRNERDITPFLGTGIVLLASVVALGYLVLQRGAQDSRWGYYPQKLSWLVALLIAVVVATTAPRIARSVLLRRLAAPATIVVTVALMLLPLPTRTSAAILASAYLPGPQVVSADTTASLFESADVAQLTVFSRYGSPGEDGFKNGWLLQQFAESGEDPVRSFAYTVDGTDIGLICALAEAPRVQLHVRTRDASLQPELDAVCPGATTVLVG